jgi:hypothetical protein
MAHGTIAPDLPLHDPRAGYMQMLEDPDALAHLLDRLARA